MWLCTLLVHTPHTIQVWGIVAFILVRSFHNLQQMNGNQLHTFFLYILTYRIGVDTVKPNNTNNEKTIFLSSLDLCTWCIVM